MDTRVLLTPLTFCSVPNHIHLNELQCNLLVVGYIRDIEEKHQNLLISHDIYKECLDIFIKSISIKVSTFETGSVYQGLECQMESMNFRSKEGKQSIQLNFKINRETPADKYEYEWQNILNDQQTAKYNKMFEKLPKDSEGKVSSTHILPFMRRSRLSVQQLQSIWRKSSLSGEIRMDKEEFALNMYFCEMGASGQSVPSALKWNQVPPNKWNTYFGILALYWINYKGEDIKYKAGHGSEFNTFTQQTFVSHPWKIVDNTGNFLGVYVPSLPDCTHVIEIDVDKMRFHCYKKQDANAT